MPTQIKNNAITIFIHGLDIMLVQDIQRIINAFIRQQSAKYVEINWSRPHTFHFFCKGGHVLTKRNDRSFVARLRRCGNQEPVNDIAVNREQLWLCHECVGDRMRTFVFF